MPFDIVFWHWLILGLLLLIAEIAAPGAIFLWMGISAAVVGGIIWINPDISWQNQFILFSIFSIISIFAWRRFYPRQALEDTDQPALNRRGAHYIGRTFSLLQPIENGIGSVQADGSRWRVAGDDLPAGQKVKVTGVDGVTLQVEACE